MITRRSFRCAAFACAAGLAGAACGGASSSDSAEPPPTAVVGDEEPGEEVPVDAGSESGAVVPAALQFTAPLIGGGEIVGDELAGKPTAFWFWSPT